MKLHENIMIIYNNVFIQYLNEEKGTSLNFWPPKLSDVAVNQTLCRCFCYIGVLYIHHVTPIYWSEVIGLLGFKHIRLEV